MVGAGDAVALADAADGDALADAAVAVALDDAKVGVALAVGAPPLGVALVVGTPLLGVALVVGAPLLGVASADADGDAVAEKINGDVVAVAVRATAGVIVTARMRFLNMSATYSMLPFWSTATSLGKLNVAAVPTPLALPTDTPPASVFTSPVASATRRNAQLYESATYTNTPAESTVTPLGDEKREAVLEPSTNPDPLPPASVDT